MPLIRWETLLEHSGHDVRIGRLANGHYVLECEECGCSIAEEIDVNKQEDQSEGS